MEMDPEKEEYELQLFNFSSEEIVSQNMLMIQTLLRSSFAEFTEQFIKRKKVTGAAADQLRANCTKTSTEMYDDCGPAIGALNALYRDTFTIPDNVLLPTDLLQTRGQTLEMVDELTKEVRKAKEAVMQGAVFLASLDAEVELHQALQPCHAAEEAVVELVKDFQEEEVDPDEVSDLAKRLEIAGIVRNDWESESIEFDNFLLQK